MVTRRPQALAILATAAALGPEHVLAQLDLPAGVVATAAVEVGGAFNDNALLGRRGQFLNSAGGGQAGDLAARQAIEIELDRRVGSDHRVRLASRLDLALVRTRPELAGYDATTRASYEGSIGNDVMLAPELTFALRREDDAWSSRTVTPGLRGRYFFPFGVMAHFRYAYSITDFARYADGRSQTKASYANVDRQEHTAAVELRVWPDHWIRARLVLDFLAARFGGNLNANLADYAGLDAGERRSDWGGGSTASVLVTPWSWALLSAGVRCGINRSNGTPYTFNVCGALSDAMVTFPHRLSLYAALAYERYDFPNERFDRRYANTKRDFGRDLTIRLGMKLTEDLRADVGWRQVANVSNDCSAFDPDRTELGLPVYSRSYSCYAQNRFDAFLRYQPSQNERSRR